ncbi:disease resistance protein RPS5 [Eutrema salsugineum]|uniref:disease resistance protein RPS5 n=1 Tax=Eutrema salsugineum TaxID=72664 RepID=UPI000CED5ED3|nr:disease resistance protein RPS5 [Eutrema salsugineum]
MGGVGKTTILTRINNKLGQISGGFKIVIWVTVSRDSLVGKIQDDIGEKLGLRGEEWNRKKESQKAIELYSSLKDKKFVLLLDNLWRKIDLEEIGIPFPTMGSKRKVAFTTRSREVCARMGVHNPVEIQCLAPDDAWELFKKKVGANTLKSDPDIQDLAKRVVEKCGGLPLALNAIGETMACKTTAQEWNCAVDVLTSSAAEFSGMEDDILPVLKYSYDSLKSEQVKSCFKYCALFPEYYLITKDRLIDYWICEGFIIENEDREKVVHQGHDIIGILVHTCLLMEDERDKRKVKMHDVVREMALWVASEFGKHKENFVAQAKFKLHGIPRTIKNWSDVKRMSLMCNEITYLSDIPRTPELLTLFLQQNQKLQKISEEFFTSMPRLAVLDLSKNYFLSELPERISELVSLKYLDLSETSIERLPIGIRELKRLIHLNLERTLSLESISGVSHLSRLKILGLKYSALQLDLSSLKELQAMDHLDILTMSISSISKMKQLLSAYKLASLVTDLSIDSYLKVEGLSMPSMDKCRRLSISTCVIWEIKIDRTYSEIPCFPNLSDVHISECNINLKDLTWLMFVPNLSKLTIVTAKQLEDIISKEKAESVIKPFQKLKCLQLHGLPKLKSIYKSPLPFPYLRNIDVRNCPMLKKLPLNSKSTMGQEVVIEYGERKWIELIEWEDEATKDRFLPSCHQLATINP